MAEQGSALDRRWIELADRALERARKAGAGQARVVLQRQRTVELKAREGKLEKLQDATRSSLGVALYVDGRYSAHETSDLREQPLLAFVDEAVAATRQLAPDPSRGLPSDELCRGYHAGELELFDPVVVALSPEQRRERALGLEQLARQAAGAAIISASATWQDVVAQTYLALSNGASGQARRTEGWLSAEVSLADPDGRRPEGWWYAGGCRLADLPAAAAVAGEAARRAQAQLGAKPARTARVPVLVEAVAAGTLLNHLLRALDGQLVQQERSFLGPRRGAAVAAAGLTITDEPLLPRGLGSRTFDGEGMAARPFPVLERGALRSFYLDTTYARKLGQSPTTAGASNLVLAPGSRSLEELIAVLGDGVLVTSFLGGNANSTTGDFSLGIRGERIEGGRRAGPLTESNLSGNQLALWQGLAELGNDTFRSSSLLRPSLLFREVQVSGK